MAMSSKRISIRIVAVIYSPEAVYFPDRDKIKASMMRGIVVRKYQPFIFSSLPRVVWLAL